MKPAPAARSPTSLGIIRDSALSGLSSAEHKCESFSNPELKSRPFGRTSETDFVQNQMKLDSGLVIVDGQALSLPLSARACNASPASASTQHSCVF